MKKASLIALAALGLAAALTPAGAGAREAFDTDVEALSAESIGPDELLIAGQLLSDKAKCRGARDLTIAEHFTEMKRRATGPVLDTDTSSGRGAWAFKVDVSDLQGGDGFKVKAKAKDLQGNDSCKAGAQVFGI